ncbi:hypothetical protein Rhopal_007474-T1 [Rhodotorula paludigena]|uniref:AN1-type domain-containing protein n=1 Tax=Rhodotorula paludigena TaxID=86838 RepID=A0AAV5GWQ9_9BASI|nr:hypothetical protein Rhopal_007474-T1 [Rhodotorula paludigena]
MDSHFLDIGRHCSEDSCRQLDFLPFSSLADNRIPSCPLCATPISFPPGTDPNIPMDAHLSSSCPTLHPHLSSSTASFARKSPNECHAPKCHTKMVVPIQCDACREKFCPRHRFASDHACNGRQAAGAPSPAAKGARSGGTSAMKKVFGGSGSNGKSGTASGASIAAAAATRTPGLAGLAALRRAQQAKKAESAPAAPLGSSANPLVLDSSSGEDSDVQVVRSKAAPAKKEPASGGKKVLAQAGLAGKTNKRAVAEQESARKALEMRAKKGLLTEEEKIKYATMQAVAANGGSGGKDGKGTCTVC